MVEKFFDRIKEVTHDVYLIFWLFVLVLVAWFFTHAPWLERSGGEIIAALIALAVGRNKS